MRWIWIAGVVVALAFAAAGCGGSSDSASDASADTSAVTEASGMTDTTSTDTSSTDTTAGTAGLSDKCKELAQAGEKFSAAIASSSSGQDADLSATADAFKEFADKAPDELKDDFEVLADVISQYAAALQDLDLKQGEVPSAKQIAKLAQLGKSLNADDVQKASTAIAAWGQENCGATP